MRRFIVQRNIDRFEKALRDESDPVERKVIDELLAEARRDLAELDREERAQHRLPPAHRPEK